MLAKVLNLFDTRMFVQINQLLTITCSTLYECSYLDVHVHVALNMSCCNCSVNDSFDIFRNFV